MYTLHCMDPRDPLGYPDTQGTDLAELQLLCDQSNDRALEEDGFEQYWIVHEGRIIYPPAFVKDEDEQDEQHEPLLTPWGPALRRTQVQPGVTWVLSNRHGGYHLSPEVNARIPEEVRSSNGYYEADIEASLCAYFVPLRGVSPADVLVVIETQYPELYAGIVSGRVTAPSSHSA